MNRVRRSQIRELLLQLTDLKERLNATYWGAGEDMTAPEVSHIKRAIAGITNAIHDLKEVI